MTKNFVFEADMAAKKIYISREFNAPVEKVWRAYTEPDLLKKWIGPKPWIVEPKIADFTVGGVWQYAMVSPEGHKHWVYDKFTVIEKCSAISSIGIPCDDDGNPVAEAARSYVDTKFSSMDGNRTKVEAVITFEDENTIKWFVEGGFKEGTMATLEQLDELLAL